jgi:hypothetical protein
LLAVLAVVVAVTILLTMAVAVVERVDLEQELVLQFLLELL